MLEFPNALCNEKVAGACNRPRLHLGMVQLFHPEQNQMARLWQLIKSLEVFLWLQAPSAQQPQMPRKDILLQYALDIKLC